MFDQLSERLQGTMSDLRSRGKLSEDDVDKAMREIRLALLEADVNFKVTKQFVAGVREKAIGEGVLQSLKPGEMVVKVVNEQLTELMGGSGRDLVFAPQVAASTMAAKWRRTRRMPAGQPCPPYLTRRSLASSPRARSSIRNGRRRSRSSGVDAVSRILPFSSMRIS